MSSCRATNAKARTVGIRAGTQYGQYVALETVSAKLTEYVAVRCLLCGEESTVKAAVLEARAEEYTRTGKLRACKRCRKSAVTREPKFGRLCAACCGQSWSRPLDRPCRCGESFAPEEIPRPSIYRDSALGAVTGIEPVRWV